MAAKWRYHRLIVLVVKMSDRPTDFNDMKRIEGDEAVKEALDGAVAIKEPLKLTSINIMNFLAMDIPPREYILHPVIQTQGLVMIYASRGIGKTFVSTTIAYAVACGTSMFAGKWSCHKPRKVLFVDGEMPAVSLQERYAGIVAGMDGEIANVENLRIITPDLQDFGIPDLSTPEGQKLIEDNLDGVELLILDNLSSLCRTGRENESESWIPMQGWFLSLRKRGISVVIIHHAGKGGNQRGNSKKEDLLDTVVSLKRPDGYHPSEGAKFEIHYEKSRGFFGDEAKPFEASIRQDGQKIIWLVKEVKKTLQEQARELQDSGLSQRDIAKTLGTNLTKIHRTLLPQKNNDHDK